jgi:hypothetical protein
MPRKPKPPKPKRKKMDLIDRFSGEVDRTRKINSHRWIGVQRLYALGEWTRSQVADEFDITGHPDEVRQATQLANNIDAQFTVTSHALNIGNITWSNQPLALTELFGTVHRRLITDFGRVDQIRLMGRISTVGTTGSSVYAQYSLDDSAWSTLTTSVISMASIGTIVTPWENVPSIAKNSGDVYIRVVGQGGNGQADPIIGNLYLETKSYLDKLYYIGRVEAVVYCLEAYDDLLYHDQDRTVNKAKVFEDMQIAG